MASQSLQLELSVLDFISNIKEFEKNNIIEEKLWTQNQLLIGTDEAGRGPLAGPVVAAAVVLDPKNPIEGIKDSKKTSEKEREALEIKIKEKALSYQVAEVGPSEIDEINILQASLLAMKMSIGGLCYEKLPVLVDGNKTIPNLGLEQFALVKGDDRSISIGAASILAKVHRDKLMREYDKKYPEYGFAKHKGYPTAFHRAVLRKIGPCPIHRHSFSF